MLGPVPVVVVHPSHDGHEHVLLPRHLQRTAAQHSHQPAHRLLHPLPLLHHSFHVPEEHSVLLYSHLNNNIKAISQLKNEIWKNFYFYRLKPLLSLRDLKRTSAVIGEKTGPDTEN